MAVNPRQLVARRGVLVLGAGVAGAHVVSVLGPRAATVVDARPSARESLCPGAELLVGWAASVDPDRRLVAIESSRERTAVAYAQLIVALGEPVDGASRLGLPSDARGRVRVDETLRVVGAPNIWAVGDCAALPADAPDPSTPPALAGFYIPELGPKD